MDYPNPGERWHKIEDQVIKIRGPRANAYGSVSIRDWAVRVRVWKRMEAGTEQVTVYLSSSGGNYIHKVEIWKHVATVKSGQNNIVKSFLDFCPRQELEIEDLFYIYTIVKTYTTPHKLIEIITDGNPPLFMNRPGRPVLLNFNNSWITAEELVRLAKHGHQMAREIFEPS